MSTFLMESKIHSPFWINVAYVSPVGSEAAGDEM